MGSSTPNCWIQQGNLTEQGDLGWLLRTVPSPEQHLCSDPCAEGLAGQQPPVHSLAFSRAPGGVSLLPKKQKKKKNRKSHNFGCSHGAEHHNPARPPHQGHTLPSPRAPGLGEPEGSQNPASWRKQQSLALAKAQHPSRERGQPVPLPSQGSGQCRWRSPRTVLCPRWRTAPVPSLCCSANASRCWL